jgi:ElaA protein
MQINWTCTFFTELSGTQVYRIMQLRSTVFVVEQNCVYLDADDKDAVSFHVMAWVNNELAAYCRILPANVVYDVPSIGRVIVHPNFRNKGLGVDLMKNAIDYTFALYSYQHAIKIAAQCYLIEFYKSFGFVINGPQYLEDNIPHIEMLLKK